MLERPERSARPHPLRVPGEGRAHSVLHPRKICQRDRWNQGAWIAQIELCCATRPARLRPPHIKVLERFRSQALRLALTCYSVASAECVRFGKAVRRGPEDRFVRPAGRE